MPKTYTVPDNIAFHAGPLIIGIVLNWWLFGILCVQYYLYLSNTNDRKTIKAIVHLIFILDTFQTLMMMSDVFYWFVYNFGDFDKLKEYHFSAINMALVDAIIAFIVQLFYIWRISRLSGKKFVPGIFAVGSMIAFSSGVFTAAADIKFRGFKSAYQVGVVIWLLTSAITDILIAISTGYLLLKMVRDTRSTTNRTSNRIIQILTLTLETNAVTSAVALEIAIVYSFTKAIAPPVTTIYLSGGYVLGKLYSNCFMILLNQRQYYHENYTESSASGQMSSIEFGVLTSSQIATSHAEIQSRSPRRQEHDSPGKHVLRTRKDTEEVSL